ncbi:hypothetical protein LR48_Vigan11g105100 [Vigna angularis]|uniref:Uncharacterized protein n=1 Tax=Phaseolus angularis TaxID=3914 RepID=A0A0L9VSV5_PHAAN|nr:hypothetical protein LR48_Vigan11g105100 [Vigna angularis]
MGKNLRTGTRVREMTGRVTIRENNAKARARENSVGAKIRQKKGGVRARQRRGGVKVREMRGRLKNGGHRGQVRLEIGEVVDVVVAGVEVVVLVGHHWVLHFELEDFRGLKSLVQLRLLKAEGMSGGCQ